MVKHSCMPSKKVQKILNMVTHMLHCSTYKRQESQGCFSCEPPGEVLSASSQKYLPNVATVVYNDFYSYHNTYTTSRNSHG